MPGTPKRDEYESERDSWDSEVLEDADGGLSLLADAALAEADERLADAWNKAFTEGYDQAVEDLGPVDPLKRIAELEATIQRLTWMLETALRDADWSAESIEEDVADLSRRWEEREQA